MPGKCSSHNMWLLQKADFAPSPSMYAAWVKLRLLNAAEVTPSDDGFTTDCSPSTQTAGAAPAAAEI